MNNNDHPKGRIVAPRHGVAWMMQSYTLMRMHLGRLLLMTVLLQLIMGLTQIPLVGFLIILSMPALTAGLLQAFHVTAQGHRPGPSLLFVPLTSSRHAGRLFGLGALMFLVGIISVALMMPGESALLDPELLSRIEEGDVEALAAVDMNALRSLILALFVGLAISGTLSFMTIPLVWFHDRKLVVALSEGLKALFANWKPFLMLSLCLLGVLFPVSLIAGFLFTVAGSAGAFQIIVTAVVMLLILAFQLLLFGTQYCAFRDIFRIETDSAEPEPQDDSQLVA